MCQLRKAYEVKTIQQMGVREKSKTFDGKPGLARRLDAPGNYGAFIDVTLRNDATLA